MTMLTTVGLWLLTVAACAAQSQPGKRASYDGRWWLSTPNVERSGFVAGYMDCYTSEFKGPDSWEHRGYDLNRDSVTRFYKSDSSRLDAPMSAALHEFRDRASDVILNRDGERSPGPHGFFNGLYWRQMSAAEGNTEQLGFIEGYLYCHEKLANDKGGVFPKTPEEYRALITRWYRFDAKTDDIDAKREPEAIADVLFKVRSGIK